MVGGLSKLMPVSLTQFPLSQSRRLFHSSSSNGSSTPPISTPTPDLQANIRAKRIEQLTNFLRRKDAMPQSVWARYTHLLYIADNEHVPLEIHRAVLRKCTPAARFLRAQVGERAGTAVYYKAPHAHEDRLRAVIRNMRFGGFKPNLEDYNFILEQFAATGHFTGSHSVYMELTKRNLSPRSRTFGLCLQAIAHRLTLPISKERRPRVIDQAVKMCSFFLEEMRIYKTRCTSGNLDLTIRILKESSDLKTFEKLCKLAYGVDLSYPDHFEVEAIESEAQLRPKGSTTAPFSTAALNTCIDFLGSRGQISKMVQAFEVLTQPLQHVACNFDDDEFGAVNPPESRPVQPPHASPNTTTYNLLLKHASRHGHAIFVRHYLRQAVHLDELTDRSIRGHIAFGKPLHELPAPHFSINRGTVLPAFGLSNRDKNVELMRRVLIYMRRIIKRKTLNLEYYEGIKAELGGDYPEETSTENELRTSPPAQPVHVLDVKFYGQEEDKPPPVKYFNINLHTSILRRDLKEIIQLYLHASNVHARTVQRVKERLGRRVWNGKNIYLITEDTRRRASRTEWHHLVRYKQYLNSLGVKLPLPRRKKMTDVRPDPEAAPGREE